MLNARLTSLGQAIEQSKDLDLHSASLLLIYEGMCGESREYSKEKPNENGDISTSENSSPPSPSDSRSMPDNTLSVRSEFRKAFSPSTCKVDVRLIDFAHFCESKGSVECPILFGLRNLQDILRQFVS